MRIALFTNKFPARVSTFFARDTAALLQAGVDIEIFTLYPADEALWNCVPALHREEILTSVRIHYPKRWILLSKAARLLAREPQRLITWYVSGAVAAARYGPAQIGKSLYAVAHGSSCAEIRGRSFDHVVAYWGNYSGTSALVFRELTSGATPFSIFLHAGIDLYRDQVLLERKLRAAQNIIVVCEFNRRFLEKKYPALYREIEHKIHLHHLGLELGEYAFTAARQSSNRIVAVGHFCKAKGFDVLIRAIAQLHSRGTVMRVDLVGDGPEQNACQRLAARLGITDSIRFLGWLSPEKTRQQIAAAAILVHPSVGFGDAVPTVIKEAMALGTAVIASDVAGIPELLDQGRCGVLVEPGNAEQLARAIAELVGNAAACTEFGERARSRAEQLFNTWVNGRQLAKVLAGRTVRAPEGTAAIA